MYILTLCDRVLCSNRDEYLARPTTPAHFHSFSSPSPSAPILSGIDAQGGGSWFGINKENGRIAFLLVLSILLLDTTLAEISARTNITEPYNTQASSRGHLVSEYLLNGSTPNPDTSYAGFNVLLLDEQLKPHVFTNNGAGGRIVEVNTTTGCLSNGIVDVLVENQWEKVTKGSTDFRSALEQHSSEDELVELLIGVLS